MFRIKHWEEHFENHESRKVKGVRWVALPNKHDGKGYRRVAQHPEGVQIFCAWTLILQVASKMPTRGVLADEDGPLDSDDLSVMTGFPAAIFDSAFKLLTEPKIGWLEEVEAGAEAAEPPAISRHLPELPAAPGKSALEGNRREGNGTEREGARGGLTAPGGSGGTAPRSGESSDPRPPRGAPPPQPAETPSPPCRIFAEVFGSPPHVLAATEIEAEPVADLDVWRAVCRDAKANNTPPKNVGTVLRMYREQVERKGRASPPGAKPVASAKPTQEELRRKYQEKSHGPTDARPTAAAQSRG